MGQFVVELLGEYYFWGLAGFLFGSILVLWNLTQDRLSFPFAVVIWTVAVYAGLVGTRMLFVLSTNPALFIENPALAFVFWQGHLSWEGGPVLGTFAAGIVLVLTRKPVWSTLGSAAPGLALCHAFARVACLVTGCCYGAPTSVPWAIYSQHLDTMVHPTQAYSMVGELATAAILQTLWRKPERRRYLMPLYGVLLGTHRFITEAFRGGPAGPEILPGLRFYQSTSLFLALGSFCLIALLWNARRGLILSVLVAIFSTSFLAAYHRDKPPFSPPSDGAKRTYLVVTRTLFSRELTPWVRLREQAGYGVDVMECAQAPTCAEISAWLRERAANGRVSAILLVGDCKGADEADAPWHVPSNGLTVHAGAETRHGVSDALYGDLDDDQIPDVPVGRFPARGERELRSQLRKLERAATRTPAPESRRAVVWTGSEQDQAAMLAVTESLLRAIPPWLSTVLLSACEESGRGGPPAEQPALFMKHLSEPVCLSLIVGHGSFRSVQLGRHNGDDVFLAVEDVARLTSLTPSGPLFILACETGDFATPEEQGSCLAETFLDHPGGPIGVVSSSMTVEPMTNYRAARALLDALRAPPKTLGELTLRIQRSLCAAGQQDFRSLAQGDRLAQRLMEANPDSKSNDVPGLLWEEALSLNLLGDPACPLVLPERLHPAGASGRSGPGWRLHSPHGAVTARCIFRAENEYTYERAGTHRE